MPARAGPRSLPRWQRDRAARLARVSACGPQCQARSAQAPVPTGGIGQMPSRIATKVISAAAIALIVELADLGLDRLGLTDKKYRIVRKVLKSGVGAASGALIGKVLSGSEETTADETASEPAAEFA